MLLSCYRFVQDGNELLTVIWVEGILCGIAADGMVKINPSMPEDLQVPLWISV